MSLILANGDGDGQIAIANTVPADKLTIEWKTDRYYRALAAIRMPCNIEAGSYDLLLGMKESMTGEVLEFRYPDGNSIRREYYLMTLNVQGN